MWNSQELSTRIYVFQANNFKRIEIPIQTKIEQVFNYFPKAFIRYKMLNVEGSIISM